MFEKLFGKKKQTRPAIEGVAHIDGSFEEARFDSVSEADLMQDNFKDNKVSERIFHPGKRVKEESKGYDIDNRLAKKAHTKYENDQKPIRKDKNKNWKEREPFALDLPEEDVEEAHLNAEINNEGEHDDAHMYEDIDLKDAA